MNTFKTIAMKTKILTRREEEIIRLVAAERTSSEIAAALNISVRTVETHRKNLLLKTQSASAVGLLKFAIRQGWVNGFTCTEIPNKKGQQKTV